MMLITNYIGDYTYIGTFLEDFKLRKEAIRMLGLHPNADNEKILNAMWDDMGFYELVYDLLEIKIGHVYHISSHHSNDEETLAIYEIKNIKNVQKQLEIGKTRTWKV